MGISYIQKSWLIENFTKEPKYFNLKIEKKGSQWKDSSNKWEMGMKLEKQDIENLSLI